MTMFQNPTMDLISYFEYLDRPCPSFTNPADHAITLVNTDFANQDGQESEKYLDDLSSMWKSYSRNGSRSVESKEELESKAGDSFYTYKSPSVFSKQSPKLTSQFYDWCYKVVVLCHRSQLNSQRNLLAYAARSIMYICMGLLIATVWLHLGYSSDKVNERLSIHSFAVTFIAFMSVSGIPSFLEERLVYVRE